MTPEERISELEALIEQQESTIEALIESAEERDNSADSTHGAWGRLAELNTTLNDQARMLEAAMARNESLLVKQQASEALLRSTLDALDAPIVILNPDGCVIEANAIWSGMLTSTAWDEHMGIGGDYLKHCGEAAFPEGPSCTDLQDAVEDVLKGRAPLKRVEYSFNRAGIQIWHIAQVTPLPMEAGQVGCVVAHMDITAQRAAEQEAIARAEEHSLLSLVAKHTEQSVVITDAVGRLVWANEGWSRLTGYDPEKVKGQATRKLLQGPETDPQTIEVMREGIRSKRGFNVELVNYHKSGRKYWVEMDVRPILDQDGNLQRFIAVQTEITGRKEMERQLAEERTLLQAILKAIPYNIFWKDRNARYLGCNQAFADFSDLQEPKDIVGKLDQDLNPKCDPTALFSEDDSRVLSKGESVLHKTVRIDNEGGHPSYLSGSQVPLRDTADEIVGVIGIFADVTEQKNIEHQLSQANKLESIGQLAAGIAHEINTPTQFVGDNTRFLADSFKDLSPALVQAQKLAQGVLAGKPCNENAGSLIEALAESDVEYLLDEIPVALQQTLEGIGRVSKIVSAMKEFSHPGSDGHAKVDLNQALQSTITVATNEWKYVADVQTDFKEGLPAVPCLQGELNQVILNIIVNAAHAISDKIAEGTGEKGLIQISTGQDDANAIVKITDSGCGIPDELLERVFDPFFTTKEVGRGTGQGLAIAHNVIVKKHNGTLSVDSEVGVGTTFTITLPLTATSQEQEDQGALAA